VSAEIARLPFKTNKPLIVDADAVLFLPITLQGFQFIARQLRQILKISHAMQI
jgi:hypothetical protein